MRADEIRQHLDADPFIPFRLCLSDGLSYEIQHPRPGSGYDMVSGDWRAGTAVGKVGSTSASRTVLSSTSSSWKSSRRLERAGALHPFGDLGQALVDVNFAALTE